MWECGPTVPSGVRPLQNSEPLLEPLQVIEAIAPTSSNHRWWFLTFSVHLTVLNLWSFLFCFLFVCLFFLPWWLIWLKKKKIHLQCTRPGLDLWVRKIPWRREWQSTPISCLENSVDRGGLQSQEWETVGHDWVTNTFTFFSLLFTLAFFLFSLNSFPLHSPYLPSPLLFSSLFLYSLELSTNLRVQTKRLNHSLRDRTRFAVEGGE